MSKENIIFRLSDISDLKRVLDFEKDKENSLYIRQWTKEQHIDAINNSNYAHLIIETIEDKRIIGYIILVGLDNPDESIEYKRLVINEKGKGFGRQAMRMIKAYAFEELNAHRLWLEVIEQNQRAYQLYKSEGFIVEGTHRESLKIENQYYSLNVMSLLADEYRLKS